RGRHASWVSDGSSAVCSPDRAGDFHPLALAGQMGGARRAGAGAAAIDEPPLHLPGLFVERRQAVLVAAAARNRSRARASRALTRSEERRVGKEWRERGARGQL